MKLTKELKAIIKRKSGKELCEILGLDYGYTYYTWNNNNRKICSLKSDIISQFPVSELEKYLIEEDSK